MDPFAVLGIEKRFDLDLKAVDKAHRDLCRVLHPDRHVGAGASVRRAALERAIEANEALRVVRDPVSRAEALFRLSGVLVGEDKEPQVEPEFLMDVMEQREALLSIRQEKDGAALAKLVETVRASESRVLGELASVFRPGSSEPSGEHVAALGRLRFFRRFLEEAATIQEDLAASRDGARAGTAI